MPHGRRLRVSRSPAAAGHANAHPVHLVAREGCKDKGRGPNAAAVWPFCLLADQRSTKKVEIGRRVEPRTKQRSCGGARPSYPASIDRKPSVNECQSIDPGENRTRWAVTHGRPLYNRCDEGRPSSSVPSSGRRRQADVELFHKCWWYDVCRQTADSGCKQDTRSELFPVAYGRWMDGSQFSCVRATACPGAFPSSVAAWLVAEPEGFRFQSSGCRLDDERDLCNSHHLVRSYESVVCVCSFFGGGFSAQASFWGGRRKPS